MKYRHMGFLMLLVSASITGLVGVVALTGPVTAQKPAQRVGGDADATSLSSDDAIASRKQYNASRQRSRPMLARR